MNKIMTMLLGLAAAAFMLYFPYFWVRASGQSEKDFGLLKPDDKYKSFIAVCAALAVTLTPLTIISYLWPDDLGGPGPYHRGFWNALDLLGGGIAAAIIEETFFRGWLQTLIVRKAGVIWGILITSLLFGASHLIVMTGWLRFATFGPGIIMGILRHYTGSIYPAMIYHALCNIWAVWYAPVL